MTDSFSLNKYEDFQLLIQRIEKIDNSFESL